MRIPFRQGIITYPVSGNLQNFLVSSGIYVSLYAANGRTDIAFAHGGEDYLLTESETVQDAWGPLPASTDCWLYWDIDKRTAVRTFGFTLVAPVYGEDPPPAVNDQHWFDTVDQVMYVYTGGTYREVIRVFAAKFNNSVFTPVHYGTISRPYSGSQVGLNNTSVWAGRILIDDLGNPVRRSSGHFFTTEHDFFVDGSPVNILRLESTTLTGTAQYENLHAYQIVTFSNFGEIGHATYNDIQESAVAILLEDLNRYDTGTVCLQGHITNPEWNWTTVGAPLWIDDTGALVEYDPHVQSPLLYPTGKSPVARVITQNSIMFDQGLGGKGDTGAGGADVGLATDNNFGVVKLSVGATNTESPVAVGTNDPRMTDARTPLAHTQAAATIIPTPYGSLTGANLQLALQQLEDNKLSKTGGALTGPLTLSGAPTNLLHAATKAYVDAIDLSSRVAKSGDTMTGYLTLSSAPVNSFHAATKEYVDAVAQGLAVKPAVKVATTIDLGAIYNNGVAGVGGTLTIPPTATLDIDGNTTWALTDGILVKNQTNAFENGRYYLSQVGSGTTNWILTRCHYCDEASEIPSSYVFVQDGATQNGTGWVAYVDTGLGADPNVFEVGFDNITYTQFSGAGTYTAGPGLTLVGNEFSVSTINIPYDIAFYIPANPFNPSAVVGGFLLPRSVYFDTTNPTKSIAVCAVPATSVGGSVFELYLDNLKMGEVIFATGDNTGTFTWTDAVFPMYAGNVVTIRTTTNVDIDIAGIGITLVGCSEATPCYYNVPSLG